VIISLDSIGRLVFGCAVCFCEVGTEFLTRISGKKEYDYVINKKFWEERKREM
jgi:hypothetical protein